LRILKTVLVIGLLLAYIGGLFVPIMNNNAAHHANIALHMYLTGDYLNLVDRGMDYLDKPHLLFWLAALSYHLFGVTSFAYKFFSFLFVLVGIYATYRLGQRVSGQLVGRYAAMILASAFAFVLSASDVRMEAMVVSCIAFATWQLYDYIFLHRRNALLLSALGMALGFSTKGIVAVALPVMTTLAFFIQYQKTNELVSIRWLWVGLLTLLLLAPVFYCYYVQFDLHPEKVVRGRSGNSGIAFLLLGQSIQRYTGSGWGSRSPDPFYLVHTFLWAFLPWSALAFWAVGHHVSQWLRGEGQFLTRNNFALTVTTLLIFVLVSFSQFKNDHYINILFPYFAVLTAQFIVQLPSRHYKTLLVLQCIVSVLFMALITVVNTWFFPVTSLAIGILALSLLVCFLMLAFSGTDDLRTKALWLSFAATAFSFFLLNFNFYPKLLTYQSGHLLARKIKEAGINSQALYYLSPMDRNHSMDFSLQSLSPTMLIDSLRRLAAPVYLFARQEELDTLQKEKIAYDTVIQVSHYNVTTLRLRFLKPATRAQTLMPHYIVRVGSVNAH
jgi:4-amino-4-deoxy-L-arabinose transferase-like glycosyltransferase